MKKLMVAVVVIWALVLVSGVTLGAVLIADSDDDGAGASSDGATTSSAAPAPTDLDGFYDQQLTWESCSATTECATLQVPIDYADPGGGAIGLAVERTHATGDRIGSLVVNPGGPGAPGTDTAAAADFYFADALRERYDIVGFDPRGVGDSQPIDCLTDAQVDEWTAEDPDPDDAAEVDEFVGHQEEFWSGCEEKSPDLVGHVSTIEVARDMDVLRAALEEEELDYFGFSYGTRLGATYAELFPERVGRFVLDGAVDPDLSSLEGSLSQAEGFETALRSYVKDCVDGGDCFLGDTVEEGLATITGLLDQIDEQPLPTNQDRDLTVGNAFYGLVWPLYAEQAWPYLDQGLQEALDGDGSTLLFLSDNYGSRENGHYTDNGLEVISVVNCLDDPWSVSADEVPDYYDEFEEASPTFGRVFAWGLTSCDGMPQQSTEPDLEIDGSGAAPIVVIGTTRDPATPYQEAVAMADELESGVLLSRDGDGHTAYNRGNACIDDAVHGYLIDGVVPADGTDC